MRARVIIRSGELEFEIDSFDLSVVTIMKFINASKGSFLATINKDKLPNGKMRGFVVLRIPPDLLDELVGKLIKELGKDGRTEKPAPLQRGRHQALHRPGEPVAGRPHHGGTAHHHHQGRQGRIKDLLQAEKELGIWRTKIEEIEGELRYYANLVSLRR